MEPSFIPMCCPCGNSFEVSAGPPGSETECPACGKKVPFPPEKAPDTGEKKQAAAPAPENTLGKVSVEKG